MNFRKFCFVFAALGYVPFLFSQSIQFQKVYGGINSDFGKSVIQTNDHGYLISGCTSSFGAGALDAYLIKTDSIGDTIWTKSYGGIQMEIAYQVIQTTDGGYVLAGETYSYGPGTPAKPNLFLIKINSIGDSMWSKYYGGSNEDDFRAIRETNDGGFIVVGGTNSFGAGLGDVYLVKTDSIGNLQWSKTYGGTGADGGTDVRQTTDGGYIICGSTASYGPAGGNFYSIKTNNLGDTLWTKTYGNGNEVAYSVVQTSDTGFAFIGDSQSYGSGSNDCYLVKTNKTGIVQWSKTYGGSFDDHAEYFREYRDPVSGQTKYYYITGYSPGFESNASWGNYHSFLIQTNLSGVPYWTKIYGTGPSDYAYNINLTNDAGVILAGETGSFGAGGADVYLIKTDDSGTSGCYETPNGVLTTSPVTISFSGGIIGNPATVTGNAPVVVGNTQTIVTTLCQTPLGINNATENFSGISVFPNPSNGNFTVNVADKNSTIIIFNSLGEIIYSGKTTSEKTEIDLQNISSGIYFLQCKLDKGIATTKFIKD